MQYLIVYHFTGSLGSGVGNTVISVSKDLPWSESEVRDLEKKISYYIEVHENMRDVNVVFLNAMKIRDDKPCRKKWRHIR